MKYVSAVNQRYSDVYKKLGKFSFCPYGWEFFKREDVGDDVWGLFKIIGEIPVKILFSPILLPATVVTFALAVLSALVVAITHSVALLGGVLLDVFQKPSIIEGAEPAFAP